MKQICSRIISVLAAAGLCMTGITVYAEPEETTAATADETVTTEETTTTTAATTANVLSRIKYEETPSGGIRITGYQWVDETTVSLPTNIGGKPVTEIGEYAFAYCFADEIRLPEPLLYIADNAFSQCAYLKQIKIPMGCRYIGELAFEDCSALEKVEIPATVTDIGYMAFDGTPFFRNLTGDFAVFGDGVLYAWIGDGSTLTIPESVKTIGPFACSNHPALKSVTIPDTVERILDCAFDNCPALVNVSIERAPAELAADAFTGTGWYHESDAEFLQIGDMLYAYRGTAAAVTVPEGVRVINDSAFESNETLASVTLSDSVEEIRRAAFWRCENLQAASLGNVQTIGDSAFYGCKSLRDLRLGHGLTALGSYALAGTALSEVHLPDSTAQIGTMAIGYAYDPAQNSYLKQSPAPKLFANAAAAKTYAEENGLTCEPLPEEENTDPLAEVTTLPEQTRTGLTLPQGTRWIPAVIAGGALVLAGLLALLIRKMLRR